MVKSLNCTFPLKDLGALSYFLEVKVSYPKNGGMFLSQSNYILDILHHTTKIEAKPIPIHMINGPILSTDQEESFDDPHLYRSVVGALNLPSDLEILFSDNKLSNSCILQLLCIDKWLNTYYDT